MRILAIETSCDETAVALLECSGSIESPVIEPISQTLYSQVKEHAPFGGVFPALAKREHVKNIVPLFLECLEKAKDARIQGRNEDYILTSLHPSKHPRATIKEILKHERGLLEQFEQHIVPLKPPAIGAIAVTRGPGLEPALWVGVNFAKALSYLWDIPLVPTNHMEGHIASVLVDSQPTTNNKNESSIVSSMSSVVRYPAIALLASGGHTELVLIEKPLSYRRIGQTRDDAVGEAFDKVARLLGLPYPGGPQISNLAAQVRDTLQASDSKYQTNSKHPNTEKIHFPRPMMHSDDFDFSYAGLKTAVLYKIQELEAVGQPISDDLKERIAYEFEEAATDVLISKTKKALEAYGARTLIVGGGVIANTYLRERLTGLADETGVTLMLPTRELSTDNAIMIGAAAYLHLAAGETYPPFSLENETVTADGTLRL